MDNTKPLSDDIGTNFYLAPEITEGYYDNKIDIYSSGIIFIELLLNTKTMSEKYMAIKHILTNFDNKYILDEYMKLIKLMLNTKEKRCDIHSLIYKFKKIIQTQQLVII